MSNELIYLASPYSVKTEGLSHQVASSIRDARYRKVCKLAAEMMKEGKKVFCPIAHSHPIEVIGMPGEIQSGDFWLEQDFAILKNASKLAVFQMDGWEQSSGIRREIEFAEEHNIPVEYIPNKKFTRKYRKPTHGRWARAAEKRAA